jgi:acetaldehyde dehydrogenase
MAELSADCELKAAIIGSGNIGTDLMIKIVRVSSALEITVLVGIDPASQGLVRARELGVAVADQGLTGLLALSQWPGIDIVFDVTSTSAHQTLSKACLAGGKVTIDLRPAGIGSNMMIPQLNGVRAQARAMHHWKCLLPPPTARDGPKGATSSA